MKLPFKDFGKGTPVMLIHAFPLSGNMWKAQAQMLAENGFRVILPDLPGFGENTNNLHLFSISEMAIQISELLDFLNIKKSIIVSTNS